VSEVEEKDEEEEGYSSLSDDDDDDDDDACETDDSREDVRFIGDSTDTRKRNQRRRHSLTDAISGSGMDSQKCVVGSRRTSSSPQSVCSECSGWSRDRSEREIRVDECDSAVRSSRHRQSSVNASRSGGKSSSDPYQQTRLDWHAERSDNQLLCDEEHQRRVSKQTVGSTVSDRLGKDNGRLRCPFGFTSPSSNRSLSTNGEVQKPNSRQYLSQKYRCSDLYDINYPSGTGCESQRRFTQGSCLDSVQNSLACTSTPIRAETSSTFGVPMKNVSNNSFADSPALRQHRRHSQTSYRQRSGSVAVAAHGVTSSTDKLCEAFNNADVADLSPDLVIHDSRHSSTDRPVQSFISVDVADSSLVGGQSSRRSSTGRPAGSFDTADLVDSPPLESSCHDSRHPADDTAAGRRVQHGGPSVVCRRHPHFYSECTECPNCLNYAVCGVCNTFHEPQHNVDDCLPLASDRWGRDDDPLASRGRYSSYNAQLDNSDTGTVNRGQFLDGSTATCSVQNMDLHVFVNRETASNKDGQGLSGTPFDRRRSCSPQCLEDGPSDRACRRVRCLHFYTDCADCPDCCSSSFCGSCCSVHGPPEEPAVMTPRCAKHRPDDDSLPAVNVSEQMRPGDTPDHLRELPPPDGVSEIHATHASRRDLDKDDPATKESNTDNIVGNRLSTAAGSRLINPNITESSDKAQLTSSGDDVDVDNNCWTIVEKATCGVLALLIFVVFVAIYLQLTRHYFTGV